jgi:hypothetical protein
MARPVGRPALADNAKKNTIIHVRLDHADLDYLNRLTGGQPGQRSKIIRALLHAARTDLAAESNR